MKIRIYIYTMNQVDFFKCMSDQTRLDIVMLVLKQGESCVCEFTEILQLSQPKISRHLALLRTHKILQDRRQGQWIYYRLHADLPQWFGDVLVQTKSAHHTFDSLNFNNTQSTNCCE